MMSDGVTMSHVSYSMMSVWIIQSREQSGSECTRMRWKGKVQWEKRNRCLISEVITLSTLHIAGCSTLAGTMGPCIMACILMAMNMRMLWHTWRPLLLDGRTMKSSFTPGTVMVCNMKLKILSLFKWRVGYSDSFLSPTMNLFSIKMISTRLTGLQTPVKPHHFQRVMGNQSWCLIFWQWSCYAWDGRKVRLGVCECKGGSPGVCLTTAV